MRSYSYLNTALKVLDAYDGRIPFSVWLKSYFKSEPKYGSKDRRYISDLCFGNFRLGHAFKDKEGYDRLLTGYFLTKSGPDIILSEQKPDWNERAGLSTKDKLLFLQAYGELEKIFPFRDQISKEIKIHSFNESFLIQPDLFLRIRPDKKEQVLRKLQNSKVEYGLVEENCIRLHNNTKIEKLLKQDEEVVVQDYSSQKVLDSLKDKNISNKGFAWDCCAASGGKSILLHDLFPNLKITVSDIRESIIINLRNRFKRAGIKQYDYFVADVSSPSFVPKKLFEVVLCDVPCSGSGTWGRAPEQLICFKKEMIQHYALLQKKIVINAASAVKKNGYLLYITCSVFAEENEEVISFVKENTPLNLVAADYYKGYEMKADTLFAALFTA